MGVDKWGCLPRIHHVGLRELPAAGGGAAGRRHTWLRVIVRPGVETRGWAAREARLWKDGCGRDRGYLVLGQHVPRSRDSIHPFTPKMSVQPLLGSKDVDCGAEPGVHPGKEFGLSPRNLERPRERSTLRGGGEGPIKRKEPSLPTWLGNRASSDPVLTAARVSAPRSGLTLLGCVSALVGLRWPWAPRGCTSAPARPGRPGRGSAVRPGLPTRRGLCGSLSHSELRSGSERAQAMETNRAQDTGHWQNLGPG